MLIDISFIHGFGFRTGFFSWDISLVRLIPRRLFLPTRDYCPYKQSYYTLF